MSKQDIPKPEDQDCPKCTGTRKFLPEKLLNLYNRDYWEPCDRCDMYLKLLKLVDMDVATVRDLTVLLPEIWVCLGCGDKTDDCEICDLLDDLFQSKKDS